MNYLQIIQYLYPSSVQGADYYFSLMLDGVTPILTNWNTTKLGVQPTAATLQAAWAATQLNLAQQQQLLLLQSCAAAAITSGFTSSALGSPHTYPSQTTDQLNLTASIVASMIPAVETGYTTLFYCAIGSPLVWSFTSHTAAQIQQVGIDAKAWIQSQQAIHATLAAQVAAATTVATVQAIVWQ